MDYQHSYRPDQPRFLAGFFAFGVNGAGGEVNKRLSASSARLNASGSTRLGKASFLRSLICGS